VAIRRIHAPAPSKLPQQRDAISASCEVTKVSAIHEQPVHHYSKVFGLGAEGQGFIVVFDFKLMFS